MPHLSYWSHLPVEAGTIVISIAQVFKLKTDSNAVLSPKPEPEEHTHTGAWTHRVIQVVLAALG